MIEIKVKHPDVYNKIIELLVRTIVSHILSKKKINNNSINKLYNNIFAFTVFYLYINNNIVYDFKDNTYNNTFELIKKYGSVLVIKSIITNKLNYNTLTTIIIPSMCGYLVYGLVIDNYLDNHNITKIIKTLIMNITDNIIVDLIEEDESINIKQNDLIGRYIYETIVKQKILFNNL